MSQEVEQVSDLFVKERRGHAPEVRFQEVDNTPEMFRCPLHSSVCGF
jgi:hypothetical protein